MLWLYITLAVIAAVIALVTFAVAPSGRKHPDRKLLTNAYIAHRGLHDLKPGAPENSLAAFIEAISAGYTIETDIHLSSDGRVMIFHDDDLKRICGEEGSVEGKTYEELRKLRLCGTDERIPTLEELLALTDGKVPLMIEFKAVKVSECEPLCIAADKILSGYDGKYYIQSFNPFVLKWYKKHRPEICRGQLSCKMKGQGMKMKVVECMFMNFAGKPDFISYKFADRDQIFRRLTHLLGAHQVCWTLHDQKELDEARKNFKTYIFEGFLPDENNNGGI